ncbi:MAG: JAB domain-containing protein [Flavobacteriales bacterium]|nr:JAB domain-containing protein [Flavobacteriales bacterium]
MNVRLTKEQRIKILNTWDIYTIMQKVLLRENKIGRNKEHFWIIGLESNNRILFVELISLGTVNATLVEPMEVFSFALQKRAVKIILVHNHPSGELTPSRNDIEVTDKMLSIGSFVNVPVIDHVIITETEYFSFASDGLLEEIQQNSYYDLTFSQIDMLKEQMEYIKKEKTIDIARKMKEDGHDSETINKYTGLSLKDIKGL